MRYFRIFIHLILIITTPTLFAYSPQVVSYVQKVHSKKLDHNFKHKETYHLISYDTTLELLDEIESGKAEKKYRKKDLKKIDAYLAYLAGQGMLPNSNAFALRDDIEDLLRDDHNDCGYTFLSESEYSIIPAIYHDEADFTLCGSWFKKKGKKAKRFVKKHKKEIIIGAVIVVATAVVVVAVIGATSAGAAAAAGTAGAAASVSKKEELSHSTTISSKIVCAAMEEEACVFKENLVKEQFFKLENLTYEELPLEESARALGAAFAYQSLENLQTRFSQPIENPRDFAYQEINQRFSTNYAFISPQSDKKTDFNALSYQMRGEKALEFGYLTQAVHDLNRTIELNPTNSLPYLERGIAHFGLGDYESSLEDFHQFTAQAPKTYPLSISEFSLGFAKGLPKGVYESGEGILLFLADFVTHPIHTSGQIVSALSTLANLVRNDEWGVIGEALAPEIHQLIMQWDTIPSDKRGELVGYALGKHGGDILTPGALAKVASKSVKSAKELATVCKNLKIANETLILETAGGIGNGARIGEIINVGKTTTFLGEELGFTAREMGQLKQIGKLETTVAETYEHLNLPMKESIALYKKAQEALKPYTKKPMPEFEVRELIHKTGIPTFPRPKRIPENFLVMVSDRGAGMEYVHPTNTHIRVRVMPGKPHSPNPSQRKPYVIQQKSGQAFDKHGNFVQPEKPEAHIPFEEFIYRE